MGIRHGTAMMGPAAATTTTLTMRLAALGLLIRGRAPSRLLQGASWEILGLVLCQYSQVSGTVLVGTQEGALQK